MGQTSWPNKLCLFNVIIPTFSLAILFILLSVALESEAGAITNKMRYGTSKDSYVSSSMPLEQVFELTAATSTSDSHQVSSPYSKQNSYMIHTRDKLHQQAKTNGNKNINYKSLDDEDKRLLKKFYRETKSGDPFLDDSLTTESLWDEQEVGGVNALLDGANGEQQVAMAPGLSRDQEFPLFESRRKTNPADSDPFPVTLKGIAQASYSLPVRLLTSYNPVASSSLMGSSNVYISPKGNRLVGATLYGQDKDSKPGVSSKSALEAVKLHDNLMMTPPRDGKVRVRMYYHRAIHDDKRLYGTGPWKYWGHGWGLEFGYDPKSERVDKDFYQKGYTIERAFGRDFCLDQNNCRQPDPDFFKDPKNVGKYSEQATKMMLLKGGPKLGPQRNSYEYRRV